MSAFTVSLDEMSAVFTPDAGEPVRLYAEKKAPLDHRCADCCGLSSSHACRFPFYSFCAAVVGRRHPGMVI